MDAEVAVVGTGTLGAMALWRLARSGIPAIGFEQWSPGHDQSAAGGESRIFRTAYQEGSEYVPLLLRAYDLWRELEAESGQALLTLNGGLMIGATDGEDLRLVLESARRYDVPHQVLDRDEVARRFPQHRLADDESAVFDERAGFIRPEFAVLAAARCARSRGASIVTGTKVLGVESDDTGVVIRTSERDYRVRQAVLTPGPWMANFVPVLAAHVTPRKEVMTWYMATDPAAYDAERFPVFIRYGDPNTFGIPTLDGGSVKVAPSLQFAEFDDPDALDRNVAESEVTVVNQVVERHFPGLVPTPVRVSAYMDGYTTDGHAFVGRMPGSTNVWLLAGFSGHGFKMAPTFGEIAADLVRDGGTEHLIDHLAPDRFSG